MMVVGLAVVQTVVIYTQKDGRGALQRLLHQLGQHLGLLNKRKLWVCELGLKTPTAEPPIEVPSKLKDLVRVQAVVEKDWDAVVSHVHSLLSTIHSEVLQRLETPEAQPRTTVASYNRL